MQALAIVMSEFCMSKGCYYKEIKMASDWFLFYSQENPVAYALRKSLIETLANKAN